MDQPREIRIKGVLLQPLDIVPTKGGDVLRLLKPGAPLAPKFPADIGEIYFSLVEPGAVKAWKMHTAQTQRLCVPSGEIRIALYDMRADSPSLRVMDILALGYPQAYSLLQIPPGIWYGFKCASPGTAVICNCPDLPHDPEEARRAPADTPDIPYDWFGNDK